MSEYDDERDDRLTGSRKRKMKIVNEPVYVSEFYNILSRNNPTYRNKDGDTRDIPSDSYLGAINMMLYGSSYAFFELPRYKDEDVNDNDEFVGDLQQHLPSMKDTLNEPVEVEKSRRKTRRIGK